MGVPLPQGVNGDVPPPSGDAANSVMSWAFSGIGVSPAIDIFGVFNAMAWASVVDALTTTAGSAAISVATGGAIAVGSSVESVNVPAGSIVKTLAGANGTLAFPVIGLECSYDAGVPVVRNLPQTANIVGATIIGPGWPAGATITGITQPYVQGPANRRTEGVATTSVAPTASSVRPGQPLGGNGRNRCLFALTASGVLAGVDNAATFTGSSIEFVGTIELQRSVDGGQTYITCNIGGAGQLAQYSSGTPVSFIAGECERGISYRWACIAYTSGVINTRLSTTGQAATSLAINATV